MQLLARLASPYGNVVIHRNEHGIPVIEAETRPGLYFGQGFIQAHDRQIQTMLVKAIFTGRMSELLRAEGSFVAIDTYMRRYGFSAYPEREWEKLPPHCRANLQAHADGINACLRGRRLVWELRVAGLVREDWRWQDSLAIGRGFGFVGLADGQGTIEKWLMQLLRHGTTLGQLRALFPSVCDPDFSDLYRKVIVVDELVPASVRELRPIPAPRGSNNWVVAGARSASGAALAASDPHLDVNRMPAIWQEIVLSTPDVSFVGVGLPGVPGALIGRSQHLSWSPTYSCIDSVDFRIEECRGGRYRRDDGWRDFGKRVEVLKLKGGGTRELVFLENENGILQGDAQTDGYYLVENYAALHDCGASDLEGIFGLLDAKTVRDGMACFQKVKAESFNWLLADAAGEIGYQMSGRHFVRPEGTSGLLPLPGWDKRYAYRGFVDGERLPQASNPPEGFLVTANEDRNAYGTSRPCAIHMGSYRRDRITSLLASRAKWTAADMGAIQTDVFSPHAEALLERFAALIPDGPNGRVLKSWDRRYTADAKGAVLFERFYRALLRNTFGRLAWGAGVVDRWWNETGAFAGFYHYFDRVLLEGGEPWFSKSQIDEAAKDAFAEALDGDCPTLAQTRKIRMGHLLFGGKLPSFMGFDGGPVFIPGARASICQAQFFRDGGRDVSFCPSYRLLVDMGADHVLTALPGGATDRRFSRLYKNELGRYLRGEYKRVSLPAHVDRACRGA
jgi:penicillin amidase